MTQFTFALREVWRHSVRVPHFLARNVLLALPLCLGTPAWADENIIEEQLQDIGKIPNEEVMVVQRKYTRKRLRHELTPAVFGGLPFNSVRRTLYGGASYTLHINDWLGLEAMFNYSQSFIGGFVFDINNNATRPNQLPINADYQKLLFALYAGAQLSPFYGKMATLSSSIAFLEPYFYLGTGLATTEKFLYPTLVPGVGMRVFFKEWFSMRVDVRNLLYNERFISRQSGLEQTGIRSNWMILASLSFWLPKM
jgi:outer membrane beta-barrel protein